MGFLRNFVEYLFGNKIGMHEATEMFATGFRVASVTMYADIRPILEKEMELETAGVLTAQIVNYLMGTESSGNNLETAKKIKFDLIKSQIRQRAMDIMKKDRLLREVVVSTLRMRTIIAFAAQGSSYMASPEKERIEAILVEFGPEFPKKVVPEEFLALVQRYYNERCKKH